MVLADGDEEGLDWKEQEDFISMEELPHISLNSFKGVSNFQTIRVTGKIGNHELHILVDYGSTHNFLHMEIARKIGCKLKNTCPLAIIVAGGRQLTNVSECKGFEWKLQGGTFVDDMITLPLGEHVQHLFAVLDTMGKNQLYAKRIKCVFGTSHVGRFIKNFASLTRPLIVLLKRNAFKWNDEAQISFQKLKKVLVYTLVLGLPNFDQPLIVATNASGTLSTYEKEFLAVLMALEKWRGITSPAHMKWLPKLMGFDYEVVYNKGSDNGAADALLRVHTRGELLSLSYSFMTTDLAAKIALTWEEGDALQDIIAKMKQGSVAKKHYQWVNEKLIRKGKLVVGKNEAVRLELLNHFHGGAIGGHYEVKSLLKRSTHRFIGRGYGNR
ncbi:gypsy/ty3 retroelement polyprotein [Tanacetum coccineum]